MNNYTRAQRKEHGLSRVEVWLNAEHLKTLDWLAYMLGSNRSDAIRACIEAEAQSQKESMTGLSCHSVMTGLSLCFDDSTGQSCHGMTVQDSPVMVGQSCHGRTVLKRYFFIC